MKDYSTYYRNSKDRTLNDGTRLYQMHLNGFDGKDVLVNDQPRRVVITEKFSTKETLRKVIDAHGLLKVGDIFSFSDAIWVLRKLDNENDVYDTGTLEVSPSSLNWINQSGEIIISPFIFNSDNLSNFGIDEGKIITITNDRRVVAISSNDDSLKLKIGQRFIFDESAWKIISINRLNPLIELVLQSDEINPVTDNVELRIADYKDKVAIYSLNVLNGNSLSLSPNSPLQLQVEVRNRDQIVPSPTLSFSSADDSICTVDTKGLLTPISEGLTSIIVQFKDIQSVILVQVVQEQTHNYTVEIIDDSSNPFVIYRGKSKEFKAVFKDNGIVYEDNGLFTLTTSLATITSQGDNRCVLQADSVGKVTLKVVGFHAETTKEITIKSIL